MFPFCSRSVPPKRKGSPRCGRFAGRRGLQINNHAPPPKGSPHSRAQHPLSGGCGYLPFKCWVGRRQPSFSSKDRSWIAHLPKGSFGRRSEASVDLNLLHASISSKLCRRFKIQIELTLRGPGSASFRRRAASPGEWGRCHQAESRGSVRRARFSIVKTTHRHRLTVVLAPQFQNEGHRDLGPLVRLRVSRGPIRPAGAKHIGIDHPRV